MKIDEFLKNPLGKGAIIPGREDLLRGLDYRLQVMQKHKTIEMNIYTLKKDVYYHLIIPTENKDRENSYDIVIKFKRTEKSDDADQTYRQYQIEFFSNCPSFTYGYAYVANINGYLIKEFADKYEPQVLKYPPVSKNPGLTFGYEKSIYFACKYIMEDKRVLLKTYVDSYAKPLTPEIIASIRHMNVIEEEYKKADKVMRDYKRKNKVKADEKTRKRRDELVSQYQNGVKQVSNVKKIKANKPGPKKIQPIKKKK
jgi:hypothetical protein